MIGFKVIQSIEAERWRKIATGSFVRIFFFSRGLGNVL